jgi:SAM-dependent methyltransferase
MAEYSGAHVTGLNISEYQLGICRERARERGLADRTSFQHGDALDMPFADATFDAVYVFEVACHMPDKARFYRECARVLKPGGPFLGLEWLERDQISRDEATKWIEPICRLHSMPDLGSPATTRAWMEGAGLDVEVVQSAAAYGNFLKNWDMLDEKTIAGLRGLPPEAVDPVLRMLTDGGIALAEAAREGAFMIAHFRARKPGIAR